jgi:hypothetical protein
LPENIFLALQKDVKIYTHQSSEDLHTEINKLAQKSKVEEPKKKPIDVGCTKSQY